MEYAYLSEVFPDMNGSSYKPLASDKRIFLGFKENEKRENEKCENKVKEIQRQIDIIKNIKPYKKLRFINNNIEYENRYIRNNNDSRWTLLQNIKELVDNAKKLNINYDDINVGIIILQNTTYKNDSKWLSAINKIMNNENNLPPMYNAIFKKSTKLN